MQEISNGIILFTPFNTEDETVTTYLVDENFNEINNWNHLYGAIPASMGYLMEDSTLWYPSQVQHPTMQSGGVGGRIQHLDWNNNILWEYIISDYDFQHHHDIEVLPNGNILAIAWERKNLEEAQNMGREIIESPLQQMWSEMIFEIEPIGSDSAHIVWEWHLWDHLVQDVNPSLDNYGIISNHPELLNINLGEIGFGGGIFGSNNADWIHLNSIYYNEHLDQIVLSSRMLSELYIIDHSTTTEEAASHTGGNSGKGGDFLYRWGNPQNYNRGDNTHQILNSQHSINWIPEGYFGSGNLMIFNNFHYGDNAAVIEISPPINFSDGTYMISDSDPYGPSQWGWMYYNNDYLSSDIQSSAFRLENGNTFITDCQGAKITEVNYSGDILFEYFSPESNALINRSQKYPIYYLLPNIGDMNADQSIDVLDIVIISNLIINEETFESNADMNFDQVIDVLDIVILINIIMDN